MIVVIINDSDNDNNASAGDNANIKCSVFCCGIQFCTSGTGCGGGVVVSESRSSPNIGRGHHRWGDATIWGGEGGGGGCAARGTVEEQVRVSAVHDIGATGDDQGALCTTYVILHE